MFNILMKFIFVLYKNLIAQIYRLGMGGWVNLFLQ